MIMKGGTTLPKLAKGFPRTDQSRSGRRYRLQDLFCSSRRCAPIINALQKGTDEINPVKPNTIAIGNPADGYYVLQAIRETGGWGESVTDEEILEGIHPFGPNRGNIYRACWGYRSGCNQEAHPKWQNSPGGVYRHQRYRQRLQNSGSRRPKGRKAINDHRHFWKASTELYEHINPTAITKPQAVEIQSSIE